MPRPCMAHSASAQSRMTPAETVWSVVVAVAVVVAVVVAVAVVVVGKDASRFETSTSDCL